MERLAATARRCVDQCMKDFGDATRCRAPIGVGQLRLFMVFHASGIADRVA
jgi:hypothetical protein